MLTTSSKELPRIPVVKNSRGFSGLFSKAGRKTSRLAYIIMKRLSLYPVEYEGSPINLDSLSREDLRVTQMKFAKAKW